MHCDRLKRGILKDQMFLTTRTEDKKGMSEEETFMEDDSDPYLLLAQYHYVLSGSVGVRAQQQGPMPIVIDTGSG